MPTEPDAHLIANDGAACAINGFDLETRTSTPPCNPIRCADDEIGSAAGNSADVRHLADLVANLDLATPTFLTFDRTGRLERSDLDADDPVQRLLGLTVPDSVLAVGICAPATVTSAEWSPVQATDHVVIHLVNRSGTSVTTLTDMSDSRWFGPTTEPQRGRVPDACRRVLGLPTCPPISSMTDFVLAAWLEVIARNALDSAGLEWSDIIALHPASHSAVAPITPTALARATVDLGSALDWDRFRRVIASVGGFPFGENASEIAAWMDDGVFSRWAIESIPSCEEALELLESVLGPGTFDRLWATVRLCE